MSRERRSQNELFERDALERARQVTPGQGRRTWRGKYIDLPESRLTPSTVMSLQIAKPVVAALASRVPDPAWWTARMRWSLDEGPRPKLKRVLMHEALRIARAGQWTAGPAVRCVTCNRPWDWDDYLEMLVDLALLELLEPQRYQSVGGKLAYLGCSERTWYSRHRERYEAIWAVLMQWLGEAARYIWANQPREELETAV